MASDWAKSAVGLHLVHYEGDTTMALLGPTMATSWQSFSVVPVSLPSASDHPNTQDVDRNAE